ncbi:hypothetical protein NE237_007786 [Protea cynaroides]|uniref:Uncharacterized protein n=1 Tax=Protea cynaroides TaxID=273540 RepID=A0A9Q0KQ28_9MAGN|nr:hypothetical protein NE237_007786 [Protea cynaroides]
MQAISSLAESYIFSGGKLYLLWRCDRGTLASTVVDWLANQLSVYNYSHRKEETPSISDPIMHRQLLPPSRTAPMQRQLPTPMESATLSPHLPPPSHSCNVKFCGVLWIVTRRPLVLQLHKTDEEQPEYAEFTFLDESGFVFLALHLSGESSFTFFCTMKVNSLLLL